MKIRRLGHACFLITAGGNRIVTDPFVADFEKARKNCPEIYDPDIIVITHGHGDHLASLKDFYGKHTTVIAIVELASILSERGYKVIGMNMGGTIDLGVKISMVNALHTSSFDGGEQTLYSGLACGYVIADGAHTAYFAGDTAVFSDMAVIDQMYSPDIAFLPVGGHYTMDVNGAIYACNNLMNLKTLIPMHYDTFPNIKADLSPLFSELTRTVAIAPKIGEEIVI